MNPEIRDIEARLRQLKPRQPGGDMIGRLERALDEAAAREASGPSSGARTNATVEDLAARRARRLRLRRLLPLAAAIAIGLSIGVVAHFTIRGPQDRIEIPEAALAQAAEAAPMAQPGDIDTDRMEAVSATNIYKNRLDEGLVLIGDGMAARRYRYQFVDRVTWRDPADGSEITLSVPREEVVLVPLHTF